MSEAATVLVTGASGFIAKHIVAQLLEAGHKVMGSVRDLSRGDEVRAAVGPELTDSGAANERLSFVALDLGEDAGWDTVFDGVDVLMHTASPFPITQPKNADDLVRPAVDGTLRALKAAHAAGVSRVVLTSSSVAVVNGRERKSVYTEADWSDPDAPQLTPYERSKTLAERAAWDFVGRDAPQMALTAINPGLVLGRPLDTHYGSSLGLVERILAGRDPMLPDMIFPVVDVVDVARMHVEALSRPETVGRRFIAAERSMGFLEMARILKAAYPDRRIATRQAPNLLMRALAVFDSSIATVLPHLGERYEMDNTAARETMGVKFTPAANALRASADFITGQAGKLRAT